MMKLNCWELKKCGREPGGDKVAELGVCPATVATKVDGINGGKNGGRCCWVVLGTLCESEAHGGFAQKVMKCMNCEVYKMIWKEENEDGTYTPPADILKALSEIEYNI